jgi:uncharacterized membrane protein YsdA (DUF1294 family)/cold shock CspA family protein
MRGHGRITSWSDDDGFGFITPKAGGDQVFVHMIALPSVGQRPKVGAKVAYDTASDAQGRVRAENVKIGGWHFSLGPAVKAFLAAGLFLLAVAAVADRGGIPFWVVWLYFGMSALSLVFYALDKSAAKRGDWRTPEATLHLISLLCGWPGALYAQQLLRHKTSKKSFRFEFWITVILNVGGLFYFFVNHGKL